MDFLNNSKFWFMKNLTDNAINSVNNKIKDDQLTAAQAEIARLQSALDVAVEGLEKIETSSGLSVRAENQPKFIAKVALDKIKQIREKTK